MRGDFAPPDSPDDDEQLHATAKQDTTLDALRAFGVVPDKPLEAREESGIFYLWPEHLSALSLWRDVQTQWRVGWNGRTGLDYAGVRFCLDLAGLCGDELRQRFEELQIMERAALLAWSEMREARR